MDQLIYIIGSGTLLFNKWQLYKKRNDGWLWGIFGIALISIPTFQNKLWINAGFHVGLIVLMSYGYLMTHKIIKQINKKTNTLLKTFIILATMAFCIYLYITSRNIDNYNDVQLLQAITALVAALFIAIQVKKIVVYGWISYIISHSCSAFVWLNIDYKEYWSIIACQILSIGVAILAIREEKEQNRKAS